MSHRTWNRQRVAEGIRRRRTGHFEAYVKCGGRTVAKHFPPKTNIAEMRRWRADTLKTLRANRPRPGFVIGSAWSHWTYLYIARAGDAVKIGIAANVASRLKELQIGQHERLELLASCPTHRDTERLVHKHFAALQIHGEWFRADDSILAFAEHVRAGKNPCALVWDVFAETSDDESLATGLTA